MKTTKRPTLYEVPKFRVRCISGHKWESAAVMMYKSLHGMTPEYLSSRFVFRNDVTSYRLRNTENKLALPQPLTNYLKKSFSYSGAGSLMFRNAPNPEFGYFI